MLRWGLTKYTTWNQVQIFSVIKCVEASDLSLTIRLAHPFIKACIWFYLHSLCHKTLAELTSSKNPKEDTHLVPKSWKVPMKTDENGT